MDHKNVALALALAGAIAPAWGAGTAANTTINSTATASFTDPSGTPQTVTSNTLALVVDEILDVTVASNDGGRVAATSPQVGAVLAFSVTNIGNGTEAFELSFAQAGGDQFDPGAVAIFLDNGDGVFDGDEVAYVFNVNDPVLAADAARIVYLVGSIPAGRANGDVGDLTLRATAVTSGVTGDLAGTTFGGAGDGGTDAVAGITTASATITHGFVISAVSSTLTKAVVVLDPFGGTTAVPGAAITYTLTFTLAGLGSVTLGQIVDPVPAGTTYVPNSITLNAAPLTDATDADAGRFNANQVEVTLPSPLAAPSTQVVTFQVTIN